jgi:hypothetical protein
MHPQPGHVFERVADLSEIESFPVSIAIAMDAEANSCPASGKATVRIKTNARRQRAKRRRITLLMGLNPPTFKRSCTGYIGPFSVLGRLRKGGRQYGFFRRSQHFEALRRQESTAQLRCAAPRPEVSS